MQSRRHFLSQSGMGILALAGGCQLPYVTPAYGQEAPAGELQELARLKGLKQRVLGYPINMNTPSEEFFEWRKQLFKVGIDQFAFNNVGNPFKASPIPYNTHALERETIQRFARRFGFPSDDTWGFLSHSGTDSNMHGMYIGKTILKGRSGCLPKAYFTREAHYSVQILRDLLGMEAVVVGTLADGGMDCEDLALRLSENSSDPALLVATVGTTFKGAIDNLDDIKRTLRASGHDHYVHVDAALFGGYLSFTPHANAVSCRTTEGTESGRYDSIAVSCHKFFGFPAPAGLYVMKQSLYDEFNGLFSKIHNPEYIHQVPGTITCSRDAVKPAEFYYFTNASSIARQTEDARGMLENASYLLDELQTNFERLGAVRANPLSNTVYFRDPGERVVKKYSLATMHLEVGDTAERYAHVVVMPHVGREVLSEFLEDLKEG